MIFGFSVSPSSEHEVGSGWRLAQAERAAKSAEVVSSGCSSSVAGTDASECAGAAAVEGMRDREIVESGSWSSKVGDAVWI